MGSLFTGDLYQINVLGSPKGTIRASSEHSAMLRGAWAYNKGNTSGVSVLKIECLNPCSNG